MAGGWAKDGAVSEQIEASISDELARMKARKAPVGDSLTQCAECEEPIPQARREATRQRTVKHYQQGALLAQSLVVEGVLCVGVRAGKSAVLLSGGSWRAVASTHR